MTDWVFGHLHQHGIARFKCILDLAGCTVKTGNIPVHFTRIENSVTTTPNIDECCLHGRKNILHFTKVDVPNQGILLGFRDKVLCQHAVFENSNLNAPLFLAHKHLTIY